MSKYVDTDPIIDSIYAKWGCDPTYYIDDVERGGEALDDAELIEMLRSQPESVVRCKDCIWYEIWELKKDGTDDRRHQPSFCTLYDCFHDPDWYCADGKRKEKTDG